MIKTFCDICGKEVEDDNPGRVGHSVSSGDFQAVAHIRKNDKPDDCDLCLACLIKMLTTTPKKPRKPRKDKGSHKGQKVVTENKQTKQGKTISVSETAVTEVVDKKGDNLPDISTFSVVTGQGDELHRLYLGAQIVGCKTLKEGITQLLAKFGIDREYVEGQPDSEGKALLLGILNAGNIEPNAE